MMLAPNPTPMEVKTHISRSEPAHGSGSGYGVIIRVAHTKTNQKSVSGMIKHTKSAKTPERSKERHAIRRRCSCNQMRPLVKREKAPRQDRGARRAQSFPASPLAMHLRGLIRSRAPTRARNYKVTQGSRVLVLWCRAPLSTTFCTAHARRSRRRRISSHFSPHWCAKVIIDTS